MLVAEPFAKLLCSLAGNGERSVSLEVKAQSAVLPWLDFKVALQIDQAAPMDSEKLTGIEPPLQLIERLIGPIPLPLLVVDMNDAIFRNDMADGINVQ